ncbi:MAG: hypothetical protein MJE77_04745 [Proteobacteria bacterium]|nr:hypothetical protein [Pseudomonadota bacterium]
MSKANNRSVFEEFLGLFAEVRAGEGVQVLLLFANIFLILASYYILKTVRDALLIGGVELFGIKGSEIKAYLPAVMSVLLLGIVPAYGVLSTKVDRLQLLKITMGFVIACLVVLGAWGIVTGPGTAIGLTFYVWLGIINVFLIAQFWSYANDIYTEKQGKRLFAIIAIGQSLGAILGPLIADVGKDYTFPLLVFSAILFGVCLMLYIVVNARQAQDVKSASDQPTGDKPLDKDGGFQLIFQTRYLLLIALMILVTNVVNTTGEYILGAAADSHSRAEKTVEGVLGSEAAARVASSDQGEKVLSSAEQTQLKEARVSVIQSFYARFFSFVNLLGLFIQMFLVSRIFQYFGVRAALFVLPVIAFGGYAAIGLVGGLLVLRIAKTVENATDYSLQNTVKQALFLPTSREAKYKAKAAIDTFFVRFGDAASAGIVAVGLNVLAFGPTEFALVNVGLCVIWIVLNVGIAREHRKMVPDDASKPGSTD